jgi:hypothetical protein
MLETLDSVDFASLEDAYGPAVDVPGRLRTLAFGTVEEARVALGDLGAGIFHQGGYYPSAAPCVPFLIEIAGAPTPLRDEVLLFLADMSGAPPDAPEPFDPFVFRSMPGAPSYPEATSTIDAIVRGERTYLAALEAAEPSVRVAAAFLLSRITKVPDALAAALDRETDPGAAIGLRIALARCGAPLSDTEAPLAQAVTTVLATSSLEDEAFRRAIALLLREPLRPRGELPFFGGELCALALARLEPRLGEAHAWTLVHDALEARLARGETFVELPSPPMSRVCDEAPPAAPSFAGYGADRPLRSLVAALARAAFGSAAPTRLLLRDELDAKKRAVLALTVTHGVPVPAPGVPWITPELMRRFLEGGGPLDRELELEGVRAPLFSHLFAPTRASDAETVKRRVGLIAQRLTDDELFDLVIDLFSGVYELSQGGYLDAPLAHAIEALVVPRLGALRARHEAYAEALVADPHGPASLFALRPWIEASEASPPHLDRVAGAAIATMQEDGIGWLRTFPEPRRSRLVARFGNPYLLDLFGDACERLPEALLEAFVAPDCGWFVHDAESALERVSTLALEAALPGLVGRRAAIVRRALRARTGEGRLVLTIHVEAEVLHAKLVDWTGATRLEARWSRQPSVEELSALVRAIADVTDPLVTLAGDLDGTTEYRVMRLAGDAGFRGTIANGRGSSMSVGRRDDTDAQ